MKLSRNKINVIYIIGVVIFLMIEISSAVALASGIVLSLLGIRSDYIAKYRSQALQLSIILMGFGMDLAKVISTAQSGFLGTVISVVSVMGLGMLLGRYLKVESNITMLVSSGTAICGGSAIAAVAPVLGAKDHQISFSLVIVFVLNSLALIIFPIVGRYLELDQETFGYWAAIAIHDTSSVVGAAASYGSEALEVATTVKLIRALWIIPLSIVIATLQNRGGKKKIKIPWFIAFFVVAIVIAHITPNCTLYFDSFHMIGKRLMVVALFFIGSSISISEVKRAGANSFILGVILWVIISIGSLVSLYICY